AALAALLAVLILSIIILASVPPVSRDALTHHLAVPKLWIKNGGIYEIPDLPVSYYPMNLDLLYTIPLYFGNDIIPKYIHFAFALATAWLIFKYLYDKLNRLHAFAGALFFLTTPIVVKLSITAYVDLGLIFFTTASLLYLFKWVEKDFSFRFLAVSAVSCGFALGTKFNGLISLFLLSIITPYLYLKHNETYSKKETFRHQIKALSYGTLFVSIACIVYLPWMAKNYVWTGNPLYPLFSHHMETPHQDKGKTQTYVGKPSSSIEGNQNYANMKSVHTGSHFVVRKLVYGESWWETATIPIRIFFQGQDDSPKFFDGKNQNS
ncbi:ArnT family glycosyltransferase, partial [Thermodesulfobacteriota bacterium]